MKSCMCNCILRVLSSAQSWDDAENMIAFGSVRAALGRLSALSGFLCKYVLYGAFVWARRALNSQKRRFPARAVVQTGRLRSVVVESAIKC
jgi:hypothetical protein